MSCSLLNFLKMNLTISIFLVIINSIFLTVNSQEVSINAGILGTIAGSTLSTVGTTQRNYSQFLGIPYAYPPKKFQPSDIFESVLSGRPGVTFNATAFGSSCPQPFGEDTGTEDCLFLNVFTPKLPTTDNAARLPVIVFIHGAAFVSGNSNAYNGARLLNKDVVLVAFNYRLGVFGFLNLETSLAPGNAALYDAVTCLNWVQKYIHYFGGDASKVTLAGQSSGAATVSHLLLSPMSTGLFQRVIAASGSAIDVWATSKDPLIAALKIATYVNCYTPGSSVNKEQILTCLMLRNQTQLITAQNYYQYEDRKSGGIGFAAVCPSLQPMSVLPANESVILNTPISILESSTQQPVPLMIGATRDDGGFVLRLLLEGFILPNNLFNDTEFLKSKLVHTVITALGIDDSTHAISSAYEKLYLNEEARESGDFLTLTRNGLMDMMGSLFFKAGVYRTASLHQKLNNLTFLYSFDYEGEHTNHPPHVIFPGGVAHADDLIYLFQFSHLNDAEQGLSDIMVDYWVNFAYFGNPNGESTTLPKWEALNSETDMYMRFANNEIKSIEHYQESWIIANAPPNPSTSNPPNSANVIKSALGIAITFVLLLLNF